MKYDDVIYECEGESELLHVRDLSTDELEKLSKCGQFVCPGGGCTAKLCLVHSTKNGGRTCFLKAIDDGSHAENCDYRIDNYKEKSVVLRTDGFFTEKQVNDAVRRIYKDYTDPVVSREDPADEKKKKRTSRRKNGELEDGKTRLLAAGGRIIHGEDDMDGIPGRMRRRYEVSLADVGIMTTIFGVAQNIYFNQYGELRIEFEDDRLSNIIVVLGEIYKQNNPMEYRNLYLVKQYFEEKRTQRKVQVAAGGLVNEYNGNLVLELQANGSLRIDDLTIMKLMSIQAKRTKWK